LKRVLVASVQAPFITGGAEILVAELRDQLARRSFAVDVVSVPFKWYPPSEIARQALAWRMLDVTESNGEKVDLVIPTKFPSYLLAHPRKVAWLFHQHREAYDLFGSRYCSLTDSAEDRQVRESIVSMDQAALGECRARFAISRNVAGRLRRFNGLEAEALYPPPHHLGHYRHEGFGDFLFYAGRLDRLKRLDLALDALARVPAARLQVAGTGPLEPELRKQAAALGLGDRVRWLGRVSAEDLVDLYARCRAAYYAPVDEDYGFVTVESFLSGKPVLTTTDAGGPLEFVTAGESGWVAAPDADAVAQAMDAVFAAREATLRALGDEGRRRVAGITWTHVIDRLTETLACA
jgi:glycosyltransferase involved in cell wall biosynthesis